MPTKGEKARPKKLVGVGPYHLSMVKLCLSSNSTAVADISVADKLKFPYSVGHNDLSGQPNRAK